MCEIKVPIKMRSLTVSGVASEQNEFFNVIVPDCPRYIQASDEPNTYLRENPIKREKYAAVTNWPVHPRNEHGNILGAIVAIVSVDRRILLVRNGKLWGLPKGARNYHEFIRMKSLTDQVYRESGHILMHGDICMDEDDAETACENVCRETLEETGIVIKPEKLKDLGVPEPAHSGYTWFYYEHDEESKTYINIVSDAVLDNENDELRWVSGEELDTMLLRHQGCKVFNHISYLFLSSGNGGLTRVR